MFFDEVVRKQIQAFEGRCEKLYGPSSLVGTNLEPPKRRRLDKAKKKLPMSRIRAARGQYTMLRVKKLCSPYASLLGTGQTYISGTRWYKMTRQRF